MNANPVKIKQLWETKGFGEPRIRHKNSPMNTKNCNKGLNVIHKRWRCREPEAQRKQGHDYLENPRFPQCEGKDKNIQN